MAEILTVQWCNDHVLMIDQRKLPLKEEYLKCSTYEEVADAIKDMVIRGAPAIGVAAAMGVALGMNALSTRKQFLKIYQRLYESRPTAVNLKWALDRMKRVFESHASSDVAQRLKDEAIAIYEEDIQINRRMGDYGKRFIKQNARLLTYCNTGTLATAGYGTALGVIRSAYEAGTKLSVYACETRPYLQGLRLTSWELYKLGIAQKVITDNMAATLMAQHKIDAIFVGADRVAANGDVANKIGTYMLAVLAHYHQVPFYVVAPVSTIDSHCPRGSDIPIEERSPEEVTHIGKKQVGLNNVSVYNPAFDITPAKLITALITDRGVIEPVNEQNISMLNK